jgi:FkbM family methyltransferase
MVMAAPSSSADWQALAAAGRLFALGKNEDTRALGAVLPLAGVLDDAAVPGSRWHGLPLVRGEALPAGAAVVHCASSIAPVSAARRIEALTGRPATSLADLARLIEGVPLPGFVREMRTELSAHADFWDALPDRLADADSRRVLADLRRFRESGDWRAMQSYRVRIDEQYFEPFLDLRPGDWFVDAGGFDGATTADFFRHCPQAGGAWFFEPSPSNMGLARERLPADLQARMRFMPVGLADRACTLRFDSRAGSASMVSEDGDLTLALDTLDALVDTPVHLVKMDLEGGELAALQGARRHIAEDHPTLAIACYHAAADLRRIIGFVLGIRDDYDLRLRHYTEGWSETVLFFLPRRGVAR